jgi:ABC-type transport system involved in multi-copper enzyme maturation permease subunit
MALSQAPVTWLRLTLRWSNSVHTWQERLGDLALLTGILGACVIGMLAWYDVIDLPVWMILLVMAVMLAPAAALNRVGWLKLFGPVLYYDMIRQARRSRFIFLRIFYALLLVFLLACVALPHLHRFRADAHQASTIAQTYFDVFMVTQFIMVVLLTPAYVAGAIAEEKDRKTLEFMLATDLLNREIVLSKLGSRLANLGLIVLTGLPILSILQFLGGVDPNLVLAGFAVTTMTIVGQAGVSILCSATSRRPRDAIALAYLTVVLYYVLAMLLYLSTTPWMGDLGTTPLWFGDDPPTLADFVNFYNKGNLVTVIVSVQRAGARGILATELPNIVRDYALFHGVLALVTVGLAVARIRRVALVQTYGKAAKDHGRFRLWRRPQVGIFPMLWKEVHCEGAARSNWITWLVFTLLVAATFVPAGLIVYYSLDSFYDEVRSYNSLAFKMGIWGRFCNVIVGSLTLLAIAVRASTAVSTERDKQTLDTLLTTPIDSTSILFGKWVGSILSLRFGILWLGLVWAVGIVTGGLHVVALPLVMASWLVYAAFLATLGLWYSVVCKTSLRATVLTILTTILVSIAHWLPWMCCGIMMARSGMETIAEHAWKFQAGVLTPPFVLGFLPFSSEELSRNELRNDSNWRELMAFSLLGLVFWSCMAAGLFSLTSLRFRKLTLRESYMVPERGWRGSDRLAARRRPLPVAGPLSPWSPPIAGPPREEEDADEPLDHDESSR